MRLTPVIALTVTLLGGATLMNLQTAAASTPCRSGCRLATAGVVDEFDPVDNMHHFMEYIYGPVFGQLKNAIKEEPKDKKGWVPIKSGAMILAESSTLLASRVPEKADADEWKKFSQEVYQGGVKTYTAARKKDFAGVTKSFEMMISGCKNCHEKYR